MDKDTENRDLHAGAWAGKWGAGAQKAGGMCEATQKHERGTFKIKQEAQNGQQGMSMDVR